MFKLQELSPFGLMVVSDSSEQNISGVENKQIADWLSIYKLVVFRGFAPLEQHSFIDYARGFGPLLRWEFGELLNLRMEEKPLNHLFNEGRVEMHWDGAYLTEVPKYSLFQCLQAEEMTRGGETIFTDTVELVRRLNDEERQCWSNLSISYKTAKAAHYSGAVTVPLISRHPFDNREIVRFIEPFNEDNIEVNPVDVRVEGVPSEEQRKFLISIIEKIYDPRCMYQHNWKKGDYLIYDNNALLHGRNKIKENTSRHLQRIHILNGEEFSPSRPPVFIGLETQDVHV